MGRKKAVETNLERHQRTQHAIMLRAGRTALGLSQREFGKLVGVHYSSLARFETGQIRLKPSHIETIITFLVNSGLHIAMSKDSGITIHIPPHIVGAMEAIDGIRIAQDFYKAAELIGL